MKPILIVYATRGGYTRRIAERIADRIRTLRHEAQIQDARTEALPPLDRYSAVVLAASLHLGQHEQEMVRFARSRRGELAALPTLFVSVSLTEAAAADVHRPDGERLEARRAVRKALDDFERETGWRPRKSVPVAGALTETAYGPVRRSLLTRLVRRDAPEEPSRQGAFTDWAALDALVDALVGRAVELSTTAPPAAPAPARVRGAVDGRPPVP